MTEAVRSTQLTRSSRRGSSGANGDGARSPSRTTTGRGADDRLMDDEALHRTLTTGSCTYCWSRSRQEYWSRGDSSGATQQGQVRSETD